MSLEHDGFGAPEPAFVLGADEGQTDMMFSLFSG